MSDGIRIVNGNSMEVETNFRSEDTVEVANHDMKVDVSKVETIKAKYGEVYQIDIKVDEDDTNEGRNLRFFFKRPTTASFNRYLKTASKNMATSTATFTLDNIIDEQKTIFENETDKYPGLPLGVGTKLLSALGLSDSINFQKL